MPGGGDDALRVIHLVDRYLGVGQNWIHRQIRWVSPAGGLVVAERLRDPGPSAFPVESLRIIAADHPVLFKAATWLGKGRRLAPCLMAGHIRSLRPDLLHAHFGDTGWRWLLAARHLGVPMVTSFYGRDMSELPQKERWRRRYRHLFAEGTQFLCEGPVMAAGLEAMGCPRDRLGIQRLGVDADNRESRTRVKHGGEPLRVLVAARFTEKKGVPDAIAAVGLAARQVDIHLTVVGDRLAGPAGLDELRRVEQASAESGLGARLRFAGAIPYADLIALAYESDVLLQSSRTAANGDTEGGAPVTLADLGATGLPAVATRHADIPDVVRDGISGLLADEGDVAMLAAHLVSLAREPDLLPRLSAGAAAHVRERFSSTGCAATLRAHYRAAIAAGRR